MKEQRFISLKFLLSAIVAVIVAVLTSLLIIVSYNTSFNAVENAYLNQLKNFNDRINGQIADFMEQQVKNALFFSKNRDIIRALESGRYETAAEMMKSYYDENGIYENIFISTAEKNPMLVQAVAGAGIRWGNLGYDDNIAANINGKNAISDVLKSPVTGLPVCLISVPIMKGNKVIGIFGLPINIGVYSQNIIKELVIGKSGYPFITDSKGVTFAHPNIENIFKMKTGDYDWGKKMLSSPSGSFIKYVWEGKNKLLIFTRNEKYHFISAISIYYSDIESEARQIALYMIIFGIFGTFVASAAIYIIISGKLKPLDECKDVIAATANGDFSIRYTGEITNDEFGELSQALNRSTGNLEKLISEITLASQILAKSVDEIASGNENLSQRTSEQASSLEEIAATVEETNASTRQNAGNANEANNLAEASSKLAVEGGQIVEKAVLSIGDINTSSKKISEIITMINEIAFQTNLLALNAAVEAARAGDQGRGFAVVAGEVRNLAQRSAGAAKEIAALIKDSINKIDEGTELVNKSGSALKEIILSTRQVKEIISEIAASSDEQSRGIEQINTAVTEMDTMTQQNAALVEETAAASAEMSNQAQELLSMMKKFIIQKSNLKTETAGKKQKDTYEVKIKKNETVKKTTENEIIKDTRNEIKTEKKYNPEDDGFEKF